MKTLLSVHQLAVFHHVQQASSWTTLNEIATATGVSVRTVGEHCKNLTKDGIFERERVAYPAFRYRLAHDPPRTLHWFRLQEGVAALGLTTKPCSSPSC